MGREKDMLLNLKKIFSTIFLKAKKKKVAGFFSISSRKS